MALTRYCRLPPLGFFLALVFSGFSSITVSAHAETKSPLAIAPPQAFLQVLLGEPTSKDNALTFVRDTWNYHYIAMALDVIYLSRGDPAIATLIEIMQEKTEQSLRFDVQAWQKWLWSGEESFHPEYGGFKSDLFSLIDPRFKQYFTNQRPRTIRLDQVVWGGVRQDGIPPLRAPKMIAAPEATYLRDEHVVFGIAINGDIRAYPKRILAWHEMFIDEVGGQKVAGVYCTLCGTVILYETELAGTTHEMGTSGFLYQSNKLMYDKATQSLWSTMWGTPVIGPLVNKGIQLKRGAVVTTTWGEWRRRHPQTTVLSLDTGHTRDYGEGVAYKDYFATDKLMFEVPFLDQRLRNKDEVLGLFFREYPTETLAVAAKYLAANPVYHDRIGDVAFVVLTDASGANRVYDATDIKLDTWDQDEVAIDTDGKRWLVTESALRASDGTLRSRLPAHRSFWFGWYGAYPKTRLVY